VNIRDSLDAHIWHLTGRRDTLRARRGARGIAASGAGEAIAMTGPATSAWPRLLAPVGRDPECDARRSERGGERHMSEPMLTIHNHHSTACGIPPTFSTMAANLYIGYFENRHGEQWIFTCNRATREASLRGGDTGWARAHPVRDGRVDGLILTPEETAWLHACWSAVRA
jgi:hypothetical protein